MTAYSRVPQIGAGDDLVGDVTAWVDSAPLRDLVRAFGGDAKEMYAGADVAAWLTRLDAFSDRWDSRAGVERNLAKPLKLNEQQITLVAAAADALGLAAGQPPRADHYDHILMLGGLVRACVSRPASAAALLKTGRVNATAVTALGGHRPFGGDEFELADLAGLGGVSDEFSALDAGTRRAFDLTEPDYERSAPGGVGTATWTIRGYTASNGTSVRVAAAPSSQPELRRANTADTYEWFGSTLAELRPGDSVLAVTTAIYVPAQQAAAIRMLGLPYGAAVETIGIQAGDIHPELTQTFTPSQYLQEVRSAIRSLRELAHSLTPELVPARVRETG